MECGTQKLKISKLFFSKNYREISNIFVTRRRHPSRQLGFDMSSHRIAGGVCLHLAILEEVAEKTTTTLHTQPILSINHRILPR